VSDSQCGFRIYPGAFLREVALHEGGFVLETEALIRASWAGYPLVSVPIRSVYPRGRRSRFHAVTDVARIAWYLTRVWCGGGGPPDVGRPAAVASGAGLAREL
jgi:hypothetical protein